MESEGQTTGGLLLWTLAASFAAVLLLYGPPSGPLGEGDDEFSVARAMATVEAIAQEPRPAESEANARTREFVAERIRALGLEPEFQRAVVRDVAVENVLVLVPGTQSASTLCLMAHYDSRVESPGAGDDAAGTAVLLETLRALLAGPPLANDVLFLITDGEERGLLGAEAFVAAHPLAEEIDLVLNFEALGNAGPAVLFETGPNNGWSIREFARGASHPVGSSLGKTVYEAMPNDTDYSHFRDRGVAGLNFALCSGTTAYHKPSDRPENLSRWSVAHHGSNALSLVRHFGELPLEREPEPDRIYFNVLGRAFVHAPAATAVPTAVMLAVLTLFGVASFFRREHGGGELVRAIALVPVGVAAVALVAGGVVLGVDRVVALLPFGEVTPVGNVRSALAEFLATMTASAALFSLVFSRAREKRVLAFAWVARAVFAGIGVWLAFRAPGASYVVLVPLAGSFLVGFGRGATLRGTIGVLPVAWLVFPPAILVFMIASRAFVPALFAIAGVCALSLAPLAPALVGSARSRRLACALALVLALLGAVLRAQGG